MIANRKHLIRLFNVVLRVASMVSRLFLVFGLAYFLEPVELGEYGILVVSIGFSVLVVGGDYYTYSHRELLSSGRNNTCFIIQHHIVALLILYLFLLPLQYLYFFSGLLAWEFVGWFFALLVSEHLAQELNRLLIVIRQPLMAGFVLFVRMGSWVWGLILWMWLEPSSRYIENVYLFWLFGSLSSVFLACFIVWKNTQIWEWSKIDWGWIKKGFGVGGLFLISALSFKMLTTVDRYFVEYLTNAEILAAYVLYIGLAMSIYSIIDAAVFSFLYPQVVSTWRASKFVSFSILMKELWQVTLGGSVFLALFIGISSPWILGWMGKDVYLDNIWLLRILLLAAIVYSIGLVPHYGLYAKGGDKEIMMINISSLLVLIVSIGLVMTVWAEGSVAIGLLIAFSWMGAAKYKVYSGIKPVVEIPPVSS